MISHMTRFNTLWDLYRNHTFGYYQHSKSRLTSLDLIPSKKTKTKTRKYENLSDSLGQRSVLTLSLLQDTFDFLDLTFSKI